MTAQSADYVAIVRKKTWFATYDFRRYHTRASDQVHWGRVKEDIQGRPWFHALCGWSKPFNAWEMPLTSDSVSCKRCGPMGQRLIDGQADG